MESKENETSTEEDDWDLSQFTLPDGVESFFLSSSSREEMVNVDSQREKIDTETRVRAGAQNLLAPFTLAFGELLPSTLSREQKKRSKMG